MSEERNDAPRPLWWHFPYFFGALMKKFQLAAVLVVPACVFSAYALAQNATANNSTTTQSTAAADNTKSNRLEPSNRVATADSQKNDALDIDLSKRIRQSVVADKKLSTYGHNVKIVSVNGTVTLNGVVSSADEKMLIGKKAVAIAGADHVVDQMKVAQSK
jgi:hyperosmotically inducible protein